MIKQVLGPVLGKVLGGIMLLIASVTVQAKALNVVLDQAQLVTLPQQAKSIFIANANVADYQALTNTKIMVFGKQAGSTSLYVLDAGERVIYSATIKVNHDVEGLNALIGKEFPDALVSAESLSGKLFLKGQVPTAVMAEKIVRLAEGYVSQPQVSASSGDAAQSGQAEASGPSVAPPTGGNKDELMNQLAVTMPNQVNLRIRIAEVSRKVSNKLGIKWGTQGTGLGTGTFGFFDNYGGVAGAANPASWADLSVIVDALASNGMMSVLAEPNLTALSGEEASFLVGGEVALPLVFGDTANVMFKSFGVQLNFKPTVLSENRISLQVAPEVSTVASETTAVNGTTFPSFVTRKASTTIELASGQSFALGGLLQSKDVEQLQKIPLIGDVPVLGSLFRSNQFQREETELIIIATAYLVQPTRGDTLPLPTDGLIPLSDVERLLAVPQQSPESRSDVLRSDNRQPRLLGDNGFYY